MDAHAGAELSRVDRAREPVVDFSPMPERTWLVVLVITATGLIACGQLPSGDCSEKATCPGEDASTATISDGSVATPNDASVQDAGSNQDAAQPLLDAGPDCSCVPARPPGWFGPAIFTESTSSQPSCPTAFNSVAQALVDNLTAAAGTCGCACGAATGVQCPNSVTAKTGSNCPMSGSDSPSTFDNGTCTFVGSKTAVEIVSAAGVGGTCPRTATRAIPPVVWGKRGQLCTPSTCDQICPAPIGFAVCVWQSGSAASCPSAYPTKHGFFAGVDDRRDCTACNCTPDYTCTGRLRTSNTSNCSVIGVTYSSTTCGQSSAFTYVEPEISAPAGSCRASSSVPTGTATKTGPVTVCCAN